MMKLCKHDYEAQVAASRERRMHRLVLQNLPAGFPGPQPGAGPVSPLPTLQIGWAAADITPAQPVQLAGQFHARVSEGVLDPVTATALALSVGNDSHACAVLVSCDLLAFPDSLRRAVQQRLAVSLPDLDPAVVIFSATHTHTAPEVRLADEYAKTGGGISSSGNSVELPVMSERDYEAFAAQRIAQAVADAWSARAPGTISYGLGHAVVGHNRRSCTYGGESRMYGDTAAADFSHIEGGEDHDVNLLVTWDTAGHMTGLVVNVACPAQVDELLFQISADYWHETRVELRRRFGEKLFVLPQCAAAGDQSPHVQIGKAAEERMARLADRMPRQEIAVRLADAVSAVMPVLTRERDGRPLLRHRTVSVELPWRPLSDADLQTARADGDRRRQEYELLRRDLEANPAARREPRWYVPITSAYRIMKWQEYVLDRPAIQHKLPGLPVKVNVVRLGDVVFASNPFELFLDFGLQIKARSPAVQTFVVQLAGGGTYVPTARSLAGNSYGALPASTPVGPEGGRVLVDATVNAIREVMAT